MNAESYLQEILAALSPEKSPEQEKVRQLSTSSDTAGKRTAAELESRQDNLGQELDSNGDGAYNGGECRCPFQEPDVNPPSKRASLCGWTSSPKQAPSGHYTTVLEIPQGAPISRSYSTGDKIKPENQQNVTVHVTCNPDHVEPATNKCAVQLCPLDACPAGCDDAQCFPDPPETISVRDPTEKRFEDATRLLYNLDGQRGRNRGKCTLPRDCHWNCDRLSRQLQRPQRKTVPQQTKCNPKAQVQPKSSACHLKKVSACVVGFSVHLELGYLYLGRPLSLGTSKFSKINYSKKRSRSSCFITLDTAAGSAGMQVSRKAQGTWYFKQAHHSGS